MLKIHKWFNLNLYLTATFVFWDGHGMGTFVWDGHGTGMFTWDGNVPMGRRPREGNVRLARPRDGKGCV